MSSMQQCVTCHDSVLSAATNDNSAAAPARRHARKCRPLRYLDPRSPLAVTWQHNNRMIEIPQAETPSTQTSASAGHPRTGNCTPRRWTAVVGPGVCSCYRSSGRWLPDTKVQRKKAAAVKAAPPKATVEKETDVTVLKDFMQEEHVKVLEMECVSHIDSWTKSFRVRR